MGAPDDPRSPGRLGVQQESEQIESPALTHDRIPMSEFRETISDPILEFFNSIHFQKFQKYLSASAYPRLRHADWLWKEGAPLGRQQTSHL